MINYIFKYKAALIILFLFFRITDAKSQLQKADSVVINQINLFISEQINSYSFNQKTGYSKADSIVLDSCLIDNKNKIIHVFFANQLSFAPFRVSFTEYLKTTLIENLDDGFSKYKPLLYSNGSEIDKYIPNYYKTGSSRIDKTKTVGKLKRQNAPLVQNISIPNQEKANLYKINIALWHSHGWYYEPTLHRWEWQRARLFQTVEDLYPMSYTLNYIVPMLENAGANVFLPRERDWQIHEIIVDNDISTKKSQYKTNMKGNTNKSGFAIGKPPYTSENPFKLGTNEIFTTQKKGFPVVEWIPDIPETGLYPVFISYQSSSKSTEDAHYRIYHTGGVTDFIVNQTMGGGTWIYLGKFNFKEGFNPAFGKVELLNSSNKKGGVVSADAVRFGIGMGNIERNGLISERPKYQEAARYYLQYAGFPDSLVWDLDKNEESDYKDDYRSRGEWVNFLMNSEIGMGIPIDLSLAFHTDAGITDNDTVIGTLGIYSTKERGNKFPNGLSKMASRDLTDIIQTQIVNDIRIKYDSTWTRRGMWDKGYSEAFRPSVPAMLLELLSHQNFIDSRFGYEPTFQFDVSRAIYKGMVKFLSSLYKIDYVIQPLPITHFQTQITENGSFKLKWKAQEDSLESTAKPEKYIVYTRVGENGFDNGVLVEDTEYIFAKPQIDSIYSFKIAAINKGGESFPSEELSICKSSSKTETVLIINAFDRLSGPAWFNDTKFAGFLNMVDQGVPYMYDFHTIGNQYDFDKNSVWLDDDSPGWGASTAELEDKIIPGNTFNFSFVHGKTIKNSGYSFASVSDETVETGSVDLNRYKIVDFLAGEEKTSYMPKDNKTKHFQIFTNPMINKLDSYLANGGNIFFSGAHIASDMHHNGQDTIVGNLLKFRWRTSNASTNGNFYKIDSSINSEKLQMQFNTKYDNKIYTVEGADALEPINSSSTTWLRYSENNMSAGIKFSGSYKVIAIGFPFETIKTEQERNELMNEILNYLKK